MKVLRTAASNGTPIKLAEAPQEIQNVIKSLRGIGFKITSMTKWESENTDGIVVYSVPLLSPISVSYIMASDADKVCAVLKKEKLLEGTSISFNTGKLVLDIHKRIAF